jgi:hypothetical protein
MAASVQPKDEAEREMLVQAAQSVQAKRPAAKKHELRYALIVPITLAALLGAVAVVALA